MQTVGVTRRVYLPGARGVIIRTTTKESSSQASLIGVDTVSALKGPCSSQGAPYIRRPSRSATFNSNLSTWNSAAWRHNDKRYSYHSALRGKYFTNRFYMKKCPGCSAWNNLTMAQCTQCLSHLGDESIRLRMVDPLCFTANSRKGEKGTSTLGCIKIYRCFDFSVMLHPQPVSTLHLTAIPNGTFYDIKNLRKNHVPMLNKMKSRCEMIIRDIITGAEVPQFLRDKEHVMHLQSCYKTDKGSSCGSVIGDILANAIYGFNYPSSFSHVEMHAILPPIRSFNMFKAPFFYPLPKIFSDLEHLSQVKSYTPEETKQLYEKDIILEDIMDIDREFREKYNF